MKDFVLGLMFLVDIFIISVSAYSYSQNKVLKEISNNKKLMALYTENMTAWRACFIAGVTLLALLLFYVFLIKRRKTKRRTS